MPARTTLTVLLLLAIVAAAAGWGWAIRERRLLVTAEFTRRRLGYLEGENGRLRETLESRQQAEDLAATTTQRSAIEREVANLRGLPFLRPVRYREIPRSELPAILSQKLAQQVPDREFGDTAVALAALGLLPHGIDLKKTYLALLGEQVGAFYDQHSQELFTFSGHPLSNSQNRVILAHELTHALEDQHFNLSRLPLEAKGDDDRALATSALVEGDATLVMNRYMMGQLSAAVLEDSLAGALTTDVRQLAAAPRYLRETLLFPYLRGLPYCQSLYDHGGWDALAKAFQHPPSSTSEILHPERALDAAAREPFAVPFRETTVLGQTPLSDNVLGEFGVRQLFAAWLKDDAASSHAADGWRGDRYLVYGDTRANSYVWRSFWEDREASDRFFEAMSRYLQIRYKGAVSQGAGAGGKTLTITAATASPGTHSTTLACEGATEVVLIDAQDALWFSALQTLEAAMLARP